MSYAANAATHRAMGLVQREAAQKNFSRLMEHMGEDALPRLVQRTAAKIKAGAQLDALDAWVIQCATEFLERDDDRAIAAHDPADRSEYRARESREAAAFFTRDRGR